MPGELHLDTNGKYGVKLRMSLFEMDATYRKSLSQRLSSYWKLLPRYSNDLKLVASSSTFHWSPNSMSLQATNNSERRKGRGSNNHSQGNGFLWKPWLPLFFSFSVYKARMAVFKVEASLWNSISAEFTAWFAQNKPLLCTIHNTSMWLEENYYTLQLFFPVDWECVDGTTVLGELGCIVLE